MVGIMFEIIIILMGFTIISIILDFKLKNFILEAYKSIFFIIFYCAMFFKNMLKTNGLTTETYTTVALLIFFAIISISIISNKNKIYCFKGIDKNLVKVNINKISKIIDDYKDNNLDDKSKISFIKNRIVFEDVSKTQIKECLSLVGNFLDENRIKYTIKDYFTYYLKTLVLPSVIMATIAFLLIKIILI
ncbi:hypothetical protein J2Z76_000960 [Sedimentibacter acidaminivorans]|uniref:Uncharacterized protein n=1 Tax=Sedimentibacter acidaminivorans TaxID=913099 RepID=A0ABS4GBM7_9FIRM|nr:hypothetical protein [Sedimentibacter acidaminivorans]MBP1925103.1 hypothetical protein [Sedimentibacter acidaminivorans]